MALTPRAALVLLVGLFAVVIWPSGLTVRLWVLGVAALIGLDLLLAASPKALRFNRSPLTKVRVGETSSTELLVTNTGRRRAQGLIRDAWQPSAGAQGEQSRLDLPAGERTRVTTRLIPTRRGDRLADRVTIRLLGPLGVAGRQRSVHVPGTLRALHPFPARRHIPSRLAQLRQIDGRAAVRTRGQGTEFDSLRDYVDGDDVRSIDWRATARRQHLVVRTWQPEQHKRIVIVLDTSRTSAGRIDDEPRLDAAMDAALLLIALAGHARDRVEVIAGDQRVRARVSGGLDGSMLQETITRLAPVDPEIVEADWGLLASEISRLGRRRALIVLLTPLESSAIEEGLLPVLPALLARHRVVVASVSDPELLTLRSARGDVEAVYAAAASERTLQLRSRTAAALTTLGVTVLDAPPDDLPLALADHYLALKRAGLL